MKKLEAATTASVGSSTIGVMVQSNVDLGAAAFVAAFSDCEKDGKHSESLLPSV